jgi:hypothetical protein
MEKREGQMPISIFFGRKMRIYLLVLSVLWLLPRVWRATKQVDEGRRQLGREAIRGGDGARGEKGNKGRFCLHCGT